MTCVNYSVLEMAYPLRDHRDQVCFILHTSFPCDGNASKQTWELSFIFSI